MSTLSDAFELIESHPELADFVGPASDDLLQEAERALGHPLTGDYRAFVASYGAGNFGSQEIYGIFKPDFQAGPPEAIGSTLDARQSGLPPGAVMVYDEGDGTQLVVDLRNGNVEPPVARVLGLSGDAWEQEYDRFGDFLLEVVQQELGSG